jgi:hypothetical protein
MATEFPLGVFSLEVSLAAVDVEIDDAGLFLFDAGGEGFGDFEERLASGAFTGIVANSGHDSREQGSCLIEGSAGADAGASSPPAGGDDSGGVRLPLQNDSGFVLEVGFATQARGEEEEGDLEAGDTVGHRTEVI